MAPLHPHFVILGGAAGEPTTAAAQRSSSSSNPLLRRISESMYLERLDYEPSVKQLWRMAKQRSVTGPVILTRREEEAVKSARRHSVCGDFGAFSFSNTPPNVTESAKKSCGGQGDGFGVEAEALIASLRTSYQTSHVASAESALPASANAQPARTCRANASAPRDSASSLGDSAAHCFDDDIVCLLPAVDHSATHAVAASPVPIRPPARDATGAAGYCKWAIDAEKTSAAGVPRLPARRHPALTVRKLRSSAGFMDERISEYPFVTA
mmetsp:Transcript_10507/g.26924  ORF Transcript_10507/g.26924 Transcript_10507/m.26924 type:complete len:268 (+) Transcript_10507:191-994(+)